MNRKFFPLLFLLALPACATKGDFNALQQDIEELKVRSISHEKSISAVKAEAKEIAESGSKEALKSLDTLRRGTADLQANLDSIRVDFQSMTGKLDDLGNASKKPYEDISLLKEDTAKSVSAMEMRIKKLESDLEQTNAKIAAAVKAAETPESSYQKALDSYKKGDAAAAREQFSRFVEQYPDHKLAANARYWIGETYYNEKNFEQAALEFQRVIKEYPGKEKVPAATLKQAFSFRDMGDSKSARYLLKELLDNYPKAEEAGAAKEALDKLK